MSASIIPLQLRTGEGRFACAETEWLDPATKRFRIDGRMPHSALWLFAARATGNTIWRATIRAGEYATFDLASARQIDALKGPARLDQTALDLFHITTPPMDPVADACIAGCARLLQDGRASGTTARRDFKALIETLEVAARDAAKRIILAETHEPDPGTVQPIAKTKKKPGRTLTSGETSLAFSIFGGNINYASVNVYPYEYPELGGSQGDDDLLAPDGNIYFGSNVQFIVDFSAKGPDWQALFIHEMAHIWQVQHKIMNLFSIFMEHASERTPYKYLLLTPGKKFLDYDIEEQAAMIEDYFRLRRGLAIPAKHRAPKATIPSISAYVELIPFLEPSIGDP